MEGEDVYVRGHVNGFNIIFPDGPVLTKETDFPLMNWYTKLKIEGKIWQKILWLIGTGFTICVLFAVVDFTIWITKWLFRRIAEAYNVALNNFGAKFLAGLAIAIYIILAAWLIWSGHWKDLFSWLSFQYSSHQ